MTPSWDKRIKFIFYLSPRWTKTTYFITMMGMFWLDFGRYFHGTWRNVSLACAMWVEERCEVKERKKHVLTLMVQKVKCESFDEPLAKAKNHHTYQRSPKFLFNVIFCAQPPDPRHHLQEINTQTLWLIQVIQMLWYNWWETHTLMRH